VSDPLNETSVPSAAVSVRLTGDLTGDNVVGFADLLLLAQNYGATTGQPQGDVNGDGRVDFTDLLLLAQNYGATASAAALLAVAQPSRASWLFPVHRRIA
jgi:hypothetical protein